YRKIVRFFLQTPFLWYFNRLMDTLQKEHFLTEHRKNLTHTDSFHLYSTPRLTVLTKPFARFRKESLRSYWGFRNESTGYSDTKHRCVLPFFHIGLTFRFNKFLTSELKIR